MCGSWAVRMSPIIFTGIFSPDIFLRTRSALCGNRAGEATPHTSGLARGRVCVRGADPEATSGPGRDTGQGTESCRVEGSAGRLSWAWWLLAGSQAPNWNPFFSDSDRAPVSLSHFTGHLW